MNIINRETIAYLFYKICWTVKTLLSDKIKLPKKITWVEQRETLDTDGNIGDEIVNKQIFF